MSIVTKFIRSIVSTFRTAPAGKYGADRANMTVEQLRLQRKLKNADKLAKLKAGYGVGTGSK